MASDFSNIHFNMDAQNQNTYDAIVIGSGISGGWAAKELCEKGLKTLVLERGRNVEHIKDYPTATKTPWELPNRGQLTEEFLRENPLISKSAGISEDTRHFFIQDKDYPYVISVELAKAIASVIIFKRYTSRFFEMILTNNRD